MTEKHREEHRSRKMQAAATMRTQLGGNEEHQRSSSSLRHHHHGDAKDHGGGEKRRQKATCKTTVPSVITMVTESKSDWTPTIHSIPIDIVTLSSTQSGTIFRVNHPETQQPSPPPPADDDMSIIHDPTADQPYTYPQTPQFSAHHRCDLFQSFVRSLMQWELSLLQHVRFTHHPQYVKTKLLESTTNHRTLIKASRTKMQASGGSCVLPQDKLLLKIMDHAWVPRQDREQTHGESSPQHSYFVICPHFSVSILQSSPRRQC